MRYEDLISTYSPVGDIILIILCIMIASLLLDTFVRTDINFFLVLSSIFLLWVGASSNLLFYRAVKDCWSDKFIFVMRGIFHTSLLFVFIIYAIYLITLVGAKGEKVRIFMYTVIAVNILGGFFSFVSQFTHFGLYKDAHGLWHDSFIIKPFTIAYAIDFILMVILLVKVKDRIVLAIRKLLTFAMLFCVVITVTENVRDSTSYLSITFVLPILVVLFTVHSTTYNIKSGSLNGDSGNNYLIDRHRRNIPHYFMCLMLYPQNGGLPEELIKDFCNFYTTKLKHAKLFGITTDFYCLAINKKKEKNAEKVAMELMSDLFPKFYEKYKIDYKYLAISDDVIPSSYTSNMKDFFNVVQFFLSKASMCENYYIEAKEFELYDRNLHILNEINDICKRGNLEDDRVLVYCQPIKNVCTGKYDTAEALMRLNLPNMGMVYPDVFIPIAENFGKIHFLSMIILNKTCKYIKKFEKEGYDISRISVNFSFTEFKDCNFIEDFCKIVDMNKIDYDKIGVEFTESKSDSDYKLALKIVSDLKTKNVTTYLDDFGTGYSNFDRIINLDLDVIKFDRSLLLTADKDEKTKYMIHYFSDAFKKLGFKLLYEGIENDTLEKICNEGKADYLQGFMYSKPVPIEHMERFLSKR